MAKTKTKNTDDPIVNEVRRVRESLLEEYDGDIERLSEDGRKLAKKWGLKIVKAGSHQQPAKGKSKAVGEEN